MRFKISDIAEIVNIPIQNPATSGINVFVGLEHYDVGEPVITRFGSTEMLTTTVKRFNAGDILLARRNVYLRRAGKVDFSGVTSGDTIVIRVKDNLNDGVECDSSTLKSLLPFVLNTNAFWDYANTNSDGTMSKRLSPQLLLDYEFDLPSKDEQKALADKLWAAYHLKESYKKMISATEEMVKSQFIEMSKHICINSKLGDLFCFIRNGANIKQGLNTGGIPITRIETIADGFVDRSRMGYAGIEDDTYSGYYLQNNDILMSHINSMKHIGKSAIYHREDEEKIIHGMNLLCLRVKEDAVNPIYVLYLLRSDSLRSLIRSISKQAVNQASFTVSDLKDIKLTLPPRPVQNEFETIVKQADKSEFELRKSIDAIDAVIKSLINS